MCFTHRLWVTVYYKLLSIMSLGKNYDLKTEINSLRDTASIALHE